MDRSFLSRDDVIEAARNFVSIRLMTYESAEEAKLLKGLLRTRSGELENTTFALLSPDGSKKLTRAGRSPKQVFRSRGDGDSGAAMAREMTAIAEKYGYRNGAPAKKTAKKTANLPESLPAIADVRLALNVASCDSMPLVVVRGKTKKDADALAERLNPLAWSDDYRGRFAYVVTHDANATKSLSGAKSNSGILVVTPDTYGAEGKVIGQLPSTANEAAIRKVLDAALTAFTPESKDPRRHISAGRRAGVNWETEIPVTDPGPQGGRPPR